VGTANTCAAQQVTGLRLYSENPKRAR
jgi:hypothetical protein